MPAKPLELLFPLRGIDETWAFGRQPEGTSPDAQNVMPYDALDTRARGGQRWGTSKYYSVLHNSTNAIQRITSHATAVSSTDFTETFTHANAPFWSAYSSTWQHYDSPMDTSGDFFQVAIAADADSPDILSNALYVNPAKTFMTDHVYVGGAINPTATPTIEVDLLVGNQAVENAGAIFTIYYRINPALNGDCYGVRIYYDVRADSPPSVTSVVFVTGAAGASEVEDWDNAIYPATGTRFATAVTVKIVVASTGVTTVYFDDASQGSFPAATSYGTYTGVGFGTLGTAANKYDNTIDNFKVTGTSATGREYKLVAVSGGDVYTGRPAEALTLATSGANVVATSGRVDAQSAYGKVYFCDGVAADYSVWTASTNTVAAWTANTGSLPSSGANGCRYIKLYRGRLVMAGLIGDPHNWFMSAVGPDASGVGGVLDWDYGGTVSATMAVAGNSTDAGECPDIITCLAPYSDDLMFIGGDHTVWLMQGDPADRGRIDNISHQTGISGPDAYAFDPDGIFYFFGSGTIWRMAPGGVPESLSRNRMDKIFGAIDLMVKAVHLVWDNVRHGLHIFVVPVTQRSTTHYYWDQRTDSFWKVVIPAAQGPTTAYAFDGDHPDDNAILLGGWDGYIRFVDPSATDDDGTAINSYVLYPPIAAGGALKNTKINGITTILDMNSDATVLTAYAEDTVQKAVESSVSSDVAVNITGVSIANKTFTVAEDWSARMAGDRLLVAGSTGNDGSYTLASLTGSGPTVLTVVGTIANATIDGTIQYKDRTRFARSLSAGRTKMLGRITGNAIILKLSNSADETTWAIENLIVSAEVVGQTRKNQL